MKKQVQLSQSQRRQKQTMQKPDQERKMLKMQMGSLSNTEHQKKNTFLVFTVYRFVLFTGLCAVLVFLGIFAPMLWRFYFGEGGNVFYYKEGELAVHYIDVGQGDCIAINFPDGKVLVMDSGEEIYYSRVKTYLETRVLGVNKRIDYLVATHSHSDHISGFANMLRDFDVGVVYRPHNISLNDPGGDLALGTPADTLVYDRFINAAYDSRADVRFIVADEEISDYSSYSFYFHTPTVDFIQGLSPQKFDDFNEISPIISLRYSDHVFVFTGDAGIDSERLFMEEAAQDGFAVNEGNIVYLKIGHHGSKTATGSDFLEFIMPDKVVISLGAKNIYGFPNSLVITRLFSVGLVAADILMTSEQGNIAVVVGATGERVYFAFDNEADLNMLWILGFVAVFIVCFTDFRRKI